MPEGGVAVYRLEDLGARVELGFTCDEACGRVLALVTGVKDLSEADLKLVPDGGVCEVCRRVVLPIDEELGS